MTFLDPRRAFFPCLICLVSLLGTAVYADDGPHIRMASFTQSATQATMILEMELPLVRSLTESIDGGTELVLHAEMQIREPGWIADTILEYYRWIGKIRRHDLGTGYEYQAFGQGQWVFVNTLAEALEQLQTMTLKFDEDFLLMLQSNAEIFFEHRFEVAIEHLPKPLQVEVLTSSEWHFSSGWQRSLP